MAEQFISIYSTFPSPQSAQQITRVLVEEQLVACVNLFPVESIYRWKGDVHSESEVACLMKTRAGLFARVRDRLGGLHPYEVPAIVAFPIATASRDYLHWIAECTQSAEQES